MGNFNENCYKLIKMIPRGKVSTYKSIAKTLKTKAYRAVGNAMNKNPYNTNIYPCHRVISSSGKVGGYAKGTQTKIKRLKYEGIIIKNGNINLKKYKYIFNQK